MEPYVERGRFEALADRLKLPDDVALGYLIGEWTEGGDIWHEDTPTVTNEE
jgi:hypothetical protein